MDFLRYRSFYIRFFLTISSACVPSSAQFDLRPYYQDAWEWRIQDKAKTPSAINKPIEVTCRVKYFENFTLDQFFPVSSKILCFLLRWPGKILTFCAIIFLSLNLPRRYLFNREQKMLLLRYTYQVNQEFFSYCFQLSARIYPMTPVGILLLDSQLETNLLHQMIDILFFAMNVLLKNVTSPLF